MVKPPGEISKPAPPAAKGAAAREPPAAPKGDAAREQRLAEALRANLRRRKIAIRKPAARTEKD